uniref:Uncharacterized protein n=1 Tax=Rhizophora mucronata TaxID=61149 RepID=A0A2P2N3K0_RHIMU
MMVSRIGFSLCYCSHRSIQNMVRIHGVAINKLSLIYRMLL